MKKSNKNRSLKMKKKIYKVSKLESSGYMVATPESAAVGESVRIAKVRAKRNAIYRSNIGRLYLREDNEIKGAVRALSDKTKSELKKKYKEYIEELS